MFVKFCVCPSSPFDTEGRIWDVTVLLPDRYLAVYFGSSDRHLVIRFACKITSSNVHS